jgi:hypothetical protein
MAKKVQKQKTEKQSKTYDAIDILTYLSVIVIIISLVVIGLRITGYASSTNATVNISIQTFMSINFTVNSVDFGNGAVESGYTGANLTTEGLREGGEGWNIVNTPLQLENVGNVNASIALKTTLNASDFIGSGAHFEIKVSDSSGKTGSCTIANGFGSYKEIVTYDQTICSALQHGSLNSIDINVHLFVPSSAVQGSRSAIITATAS